MLSLVKSVFHPSDLSEGAERAFAHALAIALLVRTRLTIMHADKGDPRQAWQGFPGVRGTLERWGLIEGNSPRRAVFEELAIRVEKIGVKARNPLSAILGHLEKEPADLIVLGTEGRDGLPRWLRPSVAEPVARRAETMTLFVPDAARGFVSARTGELSLRRVLIPVDRDPSPDAALDVAADAAGLVGGPPLEVTLAHVGDAAERPELSMPQDPSCRWTSSFRRGDVVDEIVGEALDSSADLIVMTTSGRESLWDALRGSTTEQVVRRAPCPVLAVPAL